MASSPLPVSDQRGPPIGIVEFVVLIACLMAMGAIGTDAMLPALPAIGESLGVADPNRRQFVVGAYLGGFGIGQLVHGPLADRYGRRTVLAWALAGCALANMVAAVSASFVLLIAARMMAGAVIAASRVATVALVRDCFHGRAMARVMSMAFMVFMIVPIIAPSLGQVILLFGRWRTIFWVIAALTLMLLAWLLVRLPETLARQDRVPLSPRSIVRGWAITLTDRWSLGYMVAAAMLTGALYGYLNTIQQVMSDVFGRPALLGAVFAASAACMAVANLMNARVVERVGMRRVGHSALIVLIAVSLIHWAVAASGHETLAGFTAMMGLTLACFGLATSNFGAIAMENMGAIAGTASSVQGFAQITGGVLIGGIIGQAFDGSTMPVAAGFAIAGAVAMAAVLATERGRLFGH